MKELFPSYYRLDSQELKTLWKHSLVVFDTNALLNIYKYPNQAQEDMLRAMKAVENRLLLPHHVALEFNRHRLGVIADQVDTFDKVSAIIKDLQNSLTQKLDELNLVKLHSQIDPTPLTTSISDAADEFLEKLRLLKEKQPKVHEEDKLRAKIDQLFANRVVGGFDNQATLDSWGDDAEDRFQKRIPPGFEDAKNKTKQGTDLEYTFNGLRYKNKYGDYILWRQILEAVKARNESTNLILVTDDSKPDWWNEVRSQGKLKVGVHPNLVEEFRLNSDGGLFHIYSSEGFLTEAKKHLKVSLAESTVSRVRDVAEVVNEEPGFSSWVVETTFFHMLRQKHPDVWVERRSFFPDFVVNAGEQLIAYDLKYLRRPLGYHIFPIIEKTLESFERYRQAGRFTSFELSFIVTSEENTVPIVEGIDLSRLKIDIPFEIGIYVISQSEGERFPNLQRFK